MGKVLNARTKPSRSIIIYRTGQLGDTLVSLPAMRAIRDAYPDHKLILLTDRQPKGLVSAWEILEATGLFSEVLFYTPLSRGLAGWLLLFDLAIRIRLRRPEALFYLRESRWSKTRRDGFFFHVVCGIPNCYGIEVERVFGRRDPSGNLIRYQSEVDWLLKVVNSSGVSVPEPGKAKFELPLSDKERLRINSLWDQKGIPDEALVIGICPGSKMPAKRWPLERFVEVGRCILANLPECWLVIFGGSEDHSLGETIRGALGERVVNVAGELTVLESAEALRRCRIYVGNDTGVMHLAAAVGTPCVAIFSARDHPGRWEPYGSNHVVLRTDPPCAGCLLQVCIEQEMRCLKEIRVDEVVDAVQRILRSGIRPAAASAFINDNVWGPR